MLGHILLAGISGSGKSYTEHLIIKDVLSKGSNIILLDPKRVELLEYKNLKQCKGYANDIDDIIDMLEFACDLMNERYKKMERGLLKNYEGNPLYVFLDEVADLMILRKKSATNYLNKLSMLGRAAKVYLVICTQRATADILPRSITMNLDNIICLRQKSWRDSYYLIDMNGAEKLPRYGYCYLSTPDMSRPKKYKTDEILGVL